MRTPPHLVILGGALAASCAPDLGGGRSATVAYDSATIAIVENHGADQSSALTAIRVVDLVSPDSSLTAVPAGVAADASGGRIYVADRAAARVAVFDRSGTWVSEWGRTGDGPGEFRSPSALSLDSHGAVTVWDTGRNILSRWSTEGDLLDERPAPFDYWGPGFAIGVDRLLAVTATRTGDGATVDQRLVAHTPRGEKVLHSVAQELSPTPLPCAPGGTPAPKVLAPSVVWASRGDTTWVLNGDRYRIDVFAGDTAVWSIRRSAEPIFVTDEMAVEAVASSPGPHRDLMRRCDMTAEQVAAAVGHEPTVSSVRALAVDPDGRLWVTRASDGVRTDLIDLFDASGVYQVTFRAPGLPVAFLSASVFVGLRADAGGAGETELSVYELADPVSQGPAAPVARTRQLGYSVRSDLRTFRDCPDCPVMVELPPGRYVMGSPEGEEPAADNADRPGWTERAEKPQVEVDISYRLAIGQYEVTFAEWDRCVEAGGCTYDPPDEGWGREDRPVIHLARRDAQQYVAWLSQATGRRYRLPSEAEWEYAARAGTTTARYWGDSVGVAMAVCDGCGSRWDNMSTAPVGSFPPNPFGLYDMLGNAEEWVADCWTRTHEDAPTDGSAVTEASEWWQDGACERPVYRGGYWRSSPWTIRSAQRDYYFSGPWTDRDGKATGFRVVRTVDSDQGG